MAKDNDGMPKGVRGPGGPPPRNASAGSGKSGRATAKNTSGARSDFERRSFPLLKALHGLPKWVVVVVPGILLFLGLVLTGPVAWVGGLLLLVLGVMLAWLTALSWPAIGPGSRALRVVVVAAVFGIAVLKILGRF